jgi:hypothetical protein
VQRGLTFAPGGILDLDLQGVDPLADIDSIFVTGSVNLGAATLHVTLGYDGVIHSQYQVINNDGADPILGTFSGLPEGGTFATANGVFHITYTGGDGNDVVLTLDAIPPAISSFVSLPNGSKQISGVGEPNWFALIEATESLAPPVTWELLDVQIPGSSGLITFTDTDATNHPVRFYRIRSP